jgi:hypothetical protein
MEPNARADDLNELERRLSAWQPATTGLAPEAMLYAAGRASVARSKLWLAWPALYVCLALFSLVLSQRLAAERSGRLALIHELQKVMPATALAQSSLEKPKTRTLTPDSYLALRRQWEEQPEDKAIVSSGEEEATKPSEPATSPIFRPWPLERCSGLL